MTEKNQKLSRLFRDITSIYRFLGAEDRFRALAYQNASRAVESLPEEDISYFIQEDSLDDIPGIGRSLEREIKEFNKTGGLSRLGKLKKRVPFELMELMDIRGFGPESLKTIYKKLHLENKEEVIQALRDGTIQKLKGFGAAKVENMLHGLKLQKSMEDRMLLWDALEQGNRIFCHGDLLSLFV